jgi:Fe-S cluster biogenesis protein NfuA
MNLDFRMHAERTPNPESIKWVLSTEVVPVGETASFQAPVGPEISPLAARLFAVEGVEAVFLASHFVTVTKREDLAWTDLAEAVVGAIKAHVSAGEPGLGAAFEAESSGPVGTVEARIQQILADEIRPAVAMDGGDVVFAGFHDGVVEVMLQGSCAGCPSSTATLRFGIEARLRDAIPEVTRVVQI